MNLLQQIWAKTEEAWDDIKQSRASKSLRVQAEQDLLELQDEVIKLEGKFEEAVLKSKENKDWKTLREISLNKKLKQKELDEAAILYKEFFDRDASTILND